jgi:hypothetical protein
MAMYALSGITLIFRDTDFLKKEIQNEKNLAPGLNAEALGKELRMKGLKIEKEEGDLQRFKQGTYNKTTGVANYTTKELPYVLDKMTKLHKADTNSPLYYLNIFFGISLLFFVISSFWMFLPKTTIFKKGLYFTVAGVILTVILIML